MEPFSAKCLGVFSEARWPLASIKYLFVRPAGPNRDRQNSKKQFPLPENGFARMKSLRTSCFDAAMEEAERCFRTSGFSDADFNFRPCSDFHAPNILTFELGILQLETSARIVRCFGHARGKNVCQGAC